MEAPLQLVGCLLTSEPADPLLIDGFVTAVRRERAVVTARHAQGATFVKFNAPDARLLAMACAAATGPAGAFLRFGFACAVKSDAPAGPEAWSLSNRCITRARDLAAAAQAGEVLVSAQLAMLLLESGFALEAKEVGISGGRQVMACALGAGATAGDDAAALEEPPERSAPSAAEANVDVRLAHQLARHGEAQRLRSASDTLLTQVAEVQRKLDGDLGELRAKVEDLLGRVRDTDQKIETIESRRKMVEEVQSRANGIVHMLEDVHVNLELLNEQRAVVDHVGEKLARLDFTLQEAHNTLRALQREREVAERIEQTLKALRARGGIQMPTLQGES